MLKKIFCVFIAALICVVALFAVFASTSSFTDVPEDAYYAEAAERMSAAGILSGFGDGRFYGDWELTRAQFAALACKLLGKVDEATALAGATQFTDVPATHWSTGYVNYTAANGIINGDGDGKFRPDDSVKYEEALKVIVCLLEPDKDIAIDPADWSKNFISEAEKLGITDNLIGKKGEFMKRSDIAVVADVAYSVLSADEEAVTTTTKKSTTGTSDPVSTTAATSTSASEPSDEEPSPESTTVPPSITPPTIVVTGETLPPPPPGPTEGIEF